MSDVERHRLIVGLLDETPFASVRDLQAHLGVSAATIRRDIDKLDEQGVARKVYGGVSASTGSGVAARPFDENRDLAVEAKKAIAVEAAGLIRDGDSVIVHAGSTCFALGSEIARRNVRVATNSMPLAAHLGEHGTCSVTVTGGELHREPGVLHDPTGAVAPVYASRFFIGAQGIGADGVLESHPLLVRTVEELAGYADEVVVLADSRKFDIIARHVALPLARIGTVVTDQGLGAEARAMLEDSGVRVIVASRAEPQTAVPPAHP